MGEYNDVSKKSSLKYPTTDAYRKNYERIFGKKETESGVQISPTKKSNKKKTKDS